MKKAHLILTIIAVMMVYVALPAQNFKLANQKSKVIVEGTSTIHDWEISCEKIAGNAQIKIINDQLEAIEDLEFTVIVVGMKSGKGLMDSKTYDALKEEDNPNIIYRLVAIKEIKSKPGGKYMISAEGSLTIAGKTNTISHDLSASLIEDEMVFSGEYMLDMTAYSISPPTAMMGTIKTGKEVTIKFETTFIIKPNDHENY